MCKKSSFTKTTGFFLDNICCLYNFFFVQSLIIKAMPRLLLNQNPIFSALSASEAKETRPSGCKWPSRSSVVIQ